MADPIYYSDISKIGKDFTGNRDIALLNNEQALLESVKNILYTEPGEKIMNPLYGCPLSKYLFEPISPVTTVSMKKAILDALRNYEPRIENLVINITENPDEHSYDINIIFNMKTSVRKQQLSITLNKIR